LSIVQYSKILKIVHNLKEGLLEKSKLAQHAYEEGHRVGWDEASILEIGKQQQVQENKESAHA
jgi:hypothetical protein